MAVGVTLSKDWDLYTKALDPARFNRDLDRHMRTATRNNALYVVRIIKKRIKQRRYAKNAPLTRLLKGSGVPLVDHGDLVKFISHKVINSFEAFVGAKKQDKRGANIAQIIHDGATIRVTPKMRKFIAIAISEAIKKTGGTGDFGKAGTSPSAINIPGRPYITAVIESAQVKNRVMRHWQHAYERALMVRK